jgi:hypothetical protein
VANLFALLSTAFLEEDEEGEERPRDNKHAAALPLEELPTAVPIPASQLSHDQSLKSTKCILFVTVSTLVPLPHMPLTLAICYKN